MTTTMTHGTTGDSASYFTRQESPSETTFRGEWDDEGVYFYQAYNDDIADWSLEHQKLGGPLFKPSRMTWIKPSFAWMLYRSGYGNKDKNQKRILKIKLSHESVAELLSQCTLSDHQGRGDNKQWFGRVQWDPERDLMSPDEAGRDPRRLPGSIRSIQIGLKGRLSELYVDRIVSIEDVTDLAQRIGKAHDRMRGELGDAEAMDDLVPELPEERAYLPACSDDVLNRLKLISGGGEGKDP